MLTFANYTGALPVLRREWGLSATQAGAIFAAQQFGYTAAVLVLSSLTDLLGVRKIYLLSSLWNGLCGLLFAFFARGWWSAFLLRALGGIGLAGTYTPGMRLVVESVPAPRRGAAMGIYIACFSLGASLSLLLTGLLLPSGWQVAFVATACGPLLAAGIAWRIVRDPPERQRHTIALGTAIRNLRTLRLSAAYAMHNWELFGMRAWLPAFLTAMWVARGVPLVAATVRGAAFGALVLTASAFSNAVGGWLSDHLGRRRTILVFLSGSALCSWTIGWLTPMGLGVVLGMSVIYGLLVTAESSTLSTAVAEAALPEALGATMALQSALGFLASTIAPPVFGAILDASSPGWGWAFASLGVAALVGVVVVLRS